MGRPKTPTLRVSPNASTLSEKPLRGPDGRLLPGGPALNPGGRFAWEKEVRAKLEVAAGTAIQLLQEVLEGRPIDGTMDGKKIKMTPSPGDRLRAAEIVFSYSLTKPTAKVDLSVSQAPRWISETSKEEAMKILEAATKEDE